MKNMLSALGARREALQDGEGQKGFTLIELLVVVIIIGILAAIAVPVYLGIQDSAKDSGTKSDLANAKIAVIGYMTDNTDKKYPAAYTGLFTDSATPNADGIKYGATVSGNTASIVDGSTATSFCLIGTSKSSGKQEFNVTDKGVLRGKTCGGDTPSGTP